MSEDEDALRVLQMEVLKETQQHIVRLKNQDRHTNEQALLDYLMRVRAALEPMVQRP